MKIFWGAKLNGFLSATTEGHFYNNGTILSHVKSLEQSTIITNI